MNEEFKKQQDEALRKEKERVALLEQERKAFADKISGLRMYLQAADFMTDRERRHDDYCYRFEQMMNSEFFPGIFRYMADAVREVEGLEADNG